MTRRTTLFLVCAFEIALLLFVAAWSAVAREAVVFYCTGKNFIEVENHESNQWQPENFKFSVDKSKIQFGKDSYLGGYQSRVNLWVNETNWIAKPFNGQITFKNGNFLFVSALKGQNKAILITAKCEKFE